MNTKVHVAGPASKFGDPGTLVFDTLVFVGRFQPIHKGHLHVISEALKYSRRLIIALGSSYRPRSVKNPLCPGLRQDMIEGACAEMGIPHHRITFVKINDYTYRDGMWERELQRLVGELTTSDEKVGLVGYEKDGTSYYLRKFPQWGDHVSVTPVGGGESVMSATPLRQIWYQSIRDGLPIESYPTVIDQLTLHTIDTLNRAASQQWAIDLAKEDAKNIGYRAATRYLGTAQRDWPSPKMAADAVVTQSGAVLMIKRGGFPGKGLWALPGGMIDPDKGDRNTLDTAIRELKEETAIKVSERALRAAVVDSKFLDTFDRDPRGLVFSNAFHIKLVDRTTLPEVVAQDDAEPGSARFVPFAELDSETCYSDHYDIIQYFIARDAN